MITPLPTDTLKEFFTRCQPRVESGLGSLCESNRQPEQLWEAMIYASLSGGKRVRPMLV